jgi:dTDP-4-dehydrorhamnose reductase
MDVAGPRAIGLDRAACDISDTSAVESAMRSISPKVVINCAAYTAVDRAESEREAAFRINAGAAGIVARAAAAKSVPVIHLSTDYVYSGAGSAPHVEDEPIAPVNVYGASKGAGDLAVQAGNSAHLIVRVSWVFGAHGNNFVKTMLRLGRERSELRVVDDQVGAPTEARDISQALVTLAEQCQVTGFESWGVYHFASHPTTTWYQFARESFRRARLERPPRLIPIPTKEYKSAAIRPLNSVLDCSKIKRVFSVDRPDWRDALDRVLAQLEARSG